MVTKNPYVRFGHVVGRSALAVEVGDSAGRAAPERTCATYGLCAHMTGSSLVAKALRAGESPIEFAHRYYAGKAYSVHYLIGYDGAIYQYTDDRLRSPHVGVSAAERAHYRSGAWTRDKAISAHTRELWQAAWPHYESPQHLFPARFPNDCYVGVEMPPCGHYVRGQWTAIEAPHRPGLRHTSAQHTSFALLCCDGARRWGWPDGWWRDPRGGPRSPRIPGHEDLDLYGRSHATGGWDPGALRDEPWWDWAFVVQVIEAVMTLRSLPESARSAARTLLAG